MKHGSPDEYMSPRAGSRKNGRPSNYLSDAFGAMSKMERIKADMDGYYSKGKMAPESLYKEQAECYEAMRAMDRHFAEGGMTIVKDEEYDDGLPV